MDNRTEPRLYPWQFGETFLGYPKFNPADVIPTLLQCFRYANTCCRCRRWYLPRRLDYMYIDRMKMVWTLIMMWKKDGDPRSLCNGTCWKNHPSFCMPHPSHRTTRLHANFLHALYKPVIYILWPSPDVIYRPVLAHRSIHLSLWVSYIP